jgi:RNA-directed DNA polymerase
MRTSLLAIAKKAESQKNYRFGNLYTMLNEEMLRACWGEIRKDAAFGVDRVSAYEYQQNLEENIRDLVERLKSKRYRARLIRRQYIPKGDGRMRPLGIPVVEDKLVQLAATRILSAIYEQDFIRSSYGYRPGKSALEAVDKLTIKLQFGRYTTVVEADIKGFFDNIDHDWLLRMLERRVNDTAFLQLIKKWLKAGVLDTDGKVLHPLTGSPQGGIISPVLANIYLHHVLDLWFEKVVKKQCRGEACLIRYADDFVCAFEYREEAERFHGALGKRLAKFGLEVAAEKTRVIRMLKGDSKPSFDFLGFEFRWGKDVKGKAHLKRRTSRKKLKQSLQRFTLWCRTHRHVPVRQLMEQVSLKLRGYYNYYGLISNSEGLKEFFRAAMRIMLKWLNRRSQRRSYNWTGFHELLCRYNVPTPRITDRRRRSLAVS